METGSPLTLVSLEGDDRVVRVRLSDGSDLELAAGSLPPALPVPGEEVAPETVAALRLAADRKGVARQVFLMLDRRLRTRRDMTRKLVERGWNPDAVAAVLDRFEEEGLHSDRRFAEAWCRDTVRGKSVGRRYLESKLREKGVAADLARAVSVEILEEDAERAAALKAATAWWRRQRGDRTGPRLRARGQRFLQGRGFGPGLAAAALREAASDEEATGA